MSDGTVRRWDAYMQTEGAEPHVDWIEDETGEYVTYDDHKAAIDTLRTQARELAKVTLKDRAEACPFVDGSHGAQVWMASDTGAQLAQAVLDATKEGA